MTLDRGLISDVPDQNLLIPTSSHDNVGVVRIEFTTENTGGMTRNTAAFSSQLKLKLPCFFIIDFKLKYGDMESMLSNLVKAILLLSTN